MTKVYDSKLTNEDGLNSLLNRYTWKLACVRRDPSYESVINANNGVKVEEILTQDRTDQNDWHKNISDTVFEYKSQTPDITTGAPDNLTNLDSVYGQY